MNNEREEEIEYIIKCFECNSRNIERDYKRGEIYCKECGLVLDDDMLEEKSHGKVRGGEPIGDRTHEPQKESYTLGSIVGHRLSDGSFDRSRAGRRLRMYDKRTKLTGEQKNELRGIQACRMLGANLELTEDMKEQCAFMYKQIYKQDWVRGVSLDVRAAAIVLWLCKVNGVNRKLHEVIAHNGAHPRQTTKLLRKLAGFYRKPWLLSERNFKGDIEKYCGQLAIEPRGIADTLKLSVVIEQMGEERCLSMNTGFVVAIIYMAIQCRNYSYRTQRELSDVSGITEVTLRSNFKAICENMDICRDSLKNGAYSIEDIVSGAYKNE